MTIIITQCQHFRLTSFKIRRFPSCFPHLERFIFCRAPPLLTPSRPTTKLLNPHFPSHLPTTTTFFQTFSISKSPNFKVKTPISISMPQYYDQIIKSFSISSPDYNNFLSSIFNFLGSMENMFF